MPKAQTQTDTTVADSNDTETTGTKVIAEWLGSDGAPRVHGRSARTITRKQAKDGLLMDLTRDLRWGHETAYRADITDEPASFQEWIGKQKEFKITEE